MISADVILWLLERAKKIADQAEVTAVDKEKRGVSVRMGDIKDMSSSRSVKLSLRILRGNREASMDTSDVSRESLELLLDKTAEMLEYSEEDEANGLADAAECVGEVRELELYDPLIAALSFNDHMKVAKKMEKAAFGYDPRIKNTRDSASASSLYTVFYASTHGILRSYRITAVSRAIETVAESEQGMQVASWYCYGNNIAQAIPPEEIGRTAAHRAIRQLGGIKAPTQEVPVVFDSETASIFLRILVDAVRGGNIYRNRSFLTGRLGEEIASRLLTVRDKPLVARMPGSRPFDAEGVLSRNIDVISEGRLTSYLLDSYSARRLGLKTTGHAGGYSNLYIEYGNSSLQEIIASVHGGLYVTDLLGFGVNLLTGEFSKGARGIWIEKGELAYPVEEITIAGDLRDMLRNIEMVGDDLEFRSSIASPTIKISRMTVAGK